MAFSFRSRKRGVESPLVSSPMASTASLLESIEMKEDLDPLSEEDYHRFASLDITSLDLSLDFVTPPLSDGGESEKGIPTGRHCPPIAESKEEGRDLTDGDRSTIDEDEDDEPNIVYPHGLRLFLINISLCLVVFCVSLDNTIISTAIPKITDEFHAINSVGWYGSAYLLTTASFQLFFGKLYTFYSIKVIFLSTIALFEVGSTICATAPSSTLLIIGRAIAGLGCAGVMSGSVNIIATVVALEKRPLYTGLIGAIYGIASVAGPLLGGVFTTSLTWRWCFYINLPLGGFTFFFISLIYHAPKKSFNTIGHGWRNKLRQLDAPGTSVFVPTVVCLLLALQWGGSQYEWSNWRIILCFVLFSLGVPTFCYIQYRQQDDATLPPRIVKIRSIAAAAIYGFFLGAAFNTLVYYLPIWFQAVEGVTALESGIRNIPRIVALSIASLAAGATVQTLGYYAPFMIGSSAVVATSAGLFLAFTVPQMPSSQWIGFQILFGVGVGLGLQQPLLAAMVELGVEDIPIGTALMTFSQTLGGAISLSVAQNVFTNRLVEGLHEILPSLNAHDIINAGATNVQHAVSPSFLPRILLAYNDSIVWAYGVSVVTACVSLLPALLVEWKSIKGRGVDMSNML